MKAVRPSPSEKREGMRLNRFLARAGMGSRRGVEALVTDGRVSVDGEVVTFLATYVRPGVSEVRVDGRRINLPNEKTSFAFYKPKQVVSTLDDPEGRPCLKNFLPAGFPGLVPVGRLDYHSEGLMILTNDGELSNRLLHPRYGKIKVYSVKVKGSPDHEALARLCRGIRLEGRKTLPVKIRRMPSRETRHTWLEIQMAEGRKNQIREMFFRIDHPVIKLKRIAMGPVKLGALKPGEVRTLTAEEIALLNESPGQKPTGGKK